jgi:hypothetical protein
LAINASLLSFSTAILGGSSMDSVLEKVSPLLELVTVGGTYMEASSEHG